MEVTVYQLDVFSQTPGKGNPAAVVIGNDLTDEQMQRIAAKIGFSETIYLLPSEVATLRLRYFSPASEMPLCGHGTLAAVALWYQKLRQTQVNDLTIETNVGCLKVIVEEKNQQLFMTMAQATPKFKTFSGDLSALSSCLGIQVSDLEERLPVVYGSTGSWTLIVPVKDLAVMRKMVPQTQAFPKVLTDFPQASIHPICLATYHASSHMHGRHFSGANTGTIEDPVTGTASGVMGAYYQAFIEPNCPLPVSLQVEQGQEMGKDGYLEVVINRNQQAITVAIKGTALLVSKELLKL